MRKRPPQPDTAAVRCVVIELDACHGEAVETALLGLGAQGTQVEDDETRAAASQGASATGRVAVSAYFPTAPGLEARVAAQLGALFGQLRPAPSPTLTWSDVAPQDWSEAWKARWEVQRIGQRLVVVPSWRQAELKPDDLALTMDPGMAFGTGTHPTTRLCAEALERCCRPGHAVLDVGCGTGILALFAARLGATPVVALDNDPDAVAVARDNAARNGLLERVRFAVSGDVAVAGSFAVVVANILQKPLLELADAIAATVAPSGVLLLSGLLREQLDAVAQAYRDHGLGEISRHHQEEWGLLELRRPS